MAVCALFNPIKLCGIELTSRIAMAPMTRSRADAAAVPGPHTAEYYAQRASAGVIVSEAIGVSAQSLGYPRTPGLWTADQQSSWRAVTAAVRSRGGRIIAQLWHVGRIFSSRNNPDGLEPLAPSAVAARGQIFTLDGLKPLPIPRAMTVTEIENTVHDFAVAARAALECGFDGVEIHGANGYLIEQFLSDNANRRNDAYGGSPSRRLRFLADILDASAAQCGNLSRIGLRLSPFGDFNDIGHSDPGAVFSAAAGLLDARGGAYLHVIEPEVSGDRASREGNAAMPDVLALARSCYSGPLMAAGGYNRTRAEATLAAGRADLIAFGRPFISNPDLAERFRDGVALAEWDRTTFYTEGPHGYVDYPAATNESAN